ncbi:Hypothetical protein ORPV_1087 [Orpheovirus IHUMI-LCC2]|uniref:Uncharacterized protein n=1 Tax=Orpheovirus IHUMI-LCC2 TaxID=2023057 RepID=A0A2I2L643_9VIRU|nr:Hypothetical protein ORPV_1087 [Orpheovirus IHUMI-LCC2]SNW62991.1 Hypothetical protein ORPV_1087 [Orpheovirus IHUMI-LCC2]
MSKLVEDIKNKLEKLDYVLVENLGEKMQVPNDWIMFQADWWLGLLEGQSSYQIVLDILRDMPNEDNRDTIYVNVGTDQGCLWKSMLLKKTLNAMKDDGRRSYKLVVEYTGLVDNMYSKKSKKKRLKCIKEIKNMIQIVSCN